MISLLLLSAADAAAQGSTGSPDAYASFLDVLGALSKIVVLSMCLERAFAFLYEWTWFQALITLTKPQDIVTSPPEKVKRVPGIKALLVLLVAWYICCQYRFDVLSVLFGSKDPDKLGIIITSLIVAGGSAGAIALFQGVLGFSKEARDASIAANKSNAQAEKEKAEAAQAQAAAKKVTAEAAKSQAEAQKARADIVKLQAEAAKSETRQSLSNELS